MIRLAIGGLVAAALLAAPPRAAGQESLARAKDYYASASYDEALRVLQQLRGRAPDDPDVAAYEMFCLLAMGQDAQARAAVEQIVRRDPLYRPPATETSPRVRAYFEDVRRPLLAPLVRELYANARRHLDRRELAPASLGFDRVVALIDELGPHDDPGLADLRLLAVGFRDLARVTPSGTADEVASGSPAPAVSGPTAAAPPAPAPAEAPAPSADPPRIYGPDDADVTPPTALSRDIPSWKPMSATDRLRNYRGQLELLVDGAGKVTAITVVQRVHPEYDRALIRAAAEWTFRPATRAGVPVPYRLVVDIVLAARP
ncbi:MAG: tetratricopeptide repeat protein [Acidobacteria bacterium]|nr:tetratricopeptide repeat protein [Acidobacteriota bacterium]